MYVLQQIQSPPTRLSLMAKRQGLPVNMGILVSQTSSTSHPISFPAGGSLIWNRQNLPLPALIDSELTKVLLTPAWLSRWGSPCYHSILLTALDGKPPPRSLTLLLNLYLSSQGTKGDDYISYASFTSLSCGPWPALAQAP